MIEQKVAFKSDGLTLDSAFFRRMFFIPEMLTQLNGQSFKPVLVHILTHEGIFLKRLLIRGQLHNQVCKLRMFTTR